MATQVSLNGISRHFGADEIETLVITAAEAVCGQFDGLTTRQTDLAARAHELLIQEHASPAANLPPQRAGQPAEVWVLRHEDRHGDDVSLYASYADGLGALAQTVRSRWDNITGEPAVPATGDALDDQTAVRMYFRHRPGSESYRLYSEIVDGIGIEPAGDRADAAGSAEQQGTCGCGELIVLCDGEWLHLYNPELTGADDHDASPS